MINIIQHYPHMYKVKCDCCGKEKILSKRYFKHNGWKQHECDNKATFMNLVELQDGNPPEMMVVKVKDMDGNVVETLIEEQPFAPILVSPVDDGYIKRLVATAMAQEETAIIENPKTKKPKKK